MHDTSAYVSLTSLTTLAMALWSSLFRGGKEAGGVGAAGDETRAPSREADAKS